MDLLNIKIRRRPNKIDGIIVKKGKSWLLIKHNPVDFVLDGYGLIHTKYLQDESKIDDDIKHKILSLKNKPISRDISNLELDNTFVLFKSFKEKKTLVQLELESDEYCLIGLIDKVSEKSFVLKEMSMKGEFLDEETIRYDSVRNIYIKTDYLESYSLYLKK